MKNEKGIIIYSLLVIFLIIVFFATSTFLYNYNSLQSFAQFKGKPNQLNIEDIDKAVITEIGINLFELKDFYFLNVKNQPDLGNFKTKVNCQNISISQENVLNQLTCIDSIVIQSGDQILSTNLESETLELQQDTKLLILGQVQLNSLKLVNGSTQIISIGELNIENVECLKKCTLDIYSFKKTVRITNSGATIVSINDYSKFKHKKFYPFSKLDKNVTHTLRIKG